MTITTGEMAYYSVRMLAQGYITRFGNTGLGMNYFDNWSYTYSSGPLSGKWVRVRPQGQVVVTPHFDMSAIKVLPGGRVFNPWLLVEERIPTTHPMYTQRVLYFGHREPVMIEYKKLMKYVGIASELWFSYGETSQGAHGPKWCAATLLPFSGAVEELLPGDMMHITFSLQWQQVGEFIL